MIMTDNDKTVQVAHRVTVLMNINRSMYILVDEQDNIIAMPAHVAAGVLYVLSQVLEPDAAGTEFVTMTPDTRGVH